MTLNDLVHGLRRDCGIIMSAEWMIEQIRNPDWETMGKPYAHDWRGYVPDIIAEEWDNLSEETLAICFAMAEQQAQNEENGVRYAFRTI